MSKTLTAALAVALAGCAFTAEDLDTWDRLAAGSGRLAAYYADDARPSALRMDAAQRLLAKGELGSLIAITRAAQGRTRTARAGELADLALPALKAETPAEQAKGAEFAFHVLSFSADLDAPRRTALVGACLDWALKWIGQEYPAERRRPPEDLLQAAALAAPDQAVPAALASLAASESDAAVQATAAALSALRDPALDVKIAAALLARARAAHPQVSPVLLDALLANGNETLLKYVLALSGDLRVPHGLRKLALDAADQRLKAKGLEVYQTMLRLDDPANGDETRLVALDRVLEYGGAEQLKPALLALNPDGHWPTEGEELRALIREYCDGHIARFKVSARPVLIELTDANSWIARAFAMECVVRLYPDEAPELLIDLLEDETPLKGWTVDGTPTTFGEVVRALRQG